MADRVSATITIGGTISPDVFSELCAHINAEDLRLDWDGEVFVPAEHISGAALKLYAFEVAWGHFEELESFCYAHHIPFCRWSGSSPGSFAAERVVYDGQTKAHSFLVDDDDLVILHETTIETLGSMAVIRSFLKPAAFVVPPLIVVLER